uniref:Uncharacterized protein n=1 Tax=viral metagenome TaxID=1070528 RepID=A0A6C0JLH9_9ZZZZ
MEKKYVIANIKIPMEVNEEGSYNPLPDYITMSFEKILESPQKPEVSYNNDYIRDQILSLFNSHNQEIIKDAESETEESDSSESDPSKEEIHPIISYDELRNKQHKTHNKNISFKNKKSSTTKYSVKNYTG